jgi:hypothetical protein
MPPFIALALALTLQPPQIGVATASSSAPGLSPENAIDGDRFAACDDSLWRGRPGDSSWWWQIEFPTPRPLGAILQIAGDEATSLRNGPSSYIWQVSTDGVQWRDLPKTRVRDETRSFRIHRFESAGEIRFARIVIESAAHSAPAIREVEFYDQFDAPIAFPDWILAVSTVETPDSLREATPFVDLANSCEGFQSLQAQRVWIPDFNLDLVRAEPRPIAAFLTGNFRDWCQKDRETWRGAAEVLKARALPMWASCGGAQGLAILETVGVDRPWDCPRCRDPIHPKTPIYTHIGHTGDSPCGVYDRNIAERGAHQLKIESPDPALQGLPPIFASMESHVGQIEFVPPGWKRIVTNGPGTLTINQCLRINDFPIYAAQFHIEMKGAETSSRQIMSNFLTIASKWSRQNQ